MKIRYTNVATGAIETTDVAPSAEFFLMSKLGLLEIVKVSAPEPLVDTEWKVGHGLNGTLPLGIGFYCPRCHHSGRMVRPTENFRFKHCAQHVGRDGEAIPADILRRFFGKVAEEEGELPATPAKSSGVRMATVDV